MNLSAVVDFGALSTKNQLHTKLYDPGIIDGYHYELAKRFLTDNVRDELVVDLGCGVGCDYIARAVTEVGGHYLGVDIIDHSSQLSVGQFVQTDIFSFLQATKDRSVHFIVNSLDEFIFFQEKQQQAFIDELERTTKTHLLSLTCDVFSKYFHTHKEFSTYALDLGGIKELPEQQEILICNSHLFSRDRIIK
ncbi:MAG: class I SAM-dependent methyltransferase [Nanoarchaeota archaeon]|nr:class I SAM-dependent methyltransferase [Nanoarchaeota archaeon]